MNIATEGKKHADGIIEPRARSLDAREDLDPPLSHLQQHRGKFRERMDDGTFRIKTAG